GRVGEDVVDKRGLADAGLAANHGDASLAPDALLQQRRQRRYLLVAFEQTKCHASPPRPNQASQDQPGSARISQDHATRDMVASVYTMRLAKREAVSGVGVLD